MLNIGKTVLMTVKQCQMKTKSKIGLYFGSFNPIHIGHLILAEYILQNSDLTKIWFVVSPQNPFKKQSALLDNNTRFHLVQLAVEDNENFFATNVEFSLPKPSYTINTLTFLTEKYPDKEFSLIMGEDNLRALNKWKDYQKIVSHYNIYVYPRKKDVKAAEIIDTDMQQINAILSENSKRIHLIDAPTIDISASYIRLQIRKGQSVRYLVSEKVYKEIEKSGLYKQ